MRIGDVIELPAEPPVGTVLLVRGDNCGEFHIRRDREGWHIVGHQNPVPWPRAFAVWGPAGDSAISFEIVGMRRGSEQ